MLFVKFFAPTLQSVFLDVNKGNDVIIELPLLAVSVLPSLTNPFSLNFRKIILFAILNKVADLVRNLGIIRANFYFQKRHLLLITR